MAATEYARFAVVLRRSAEIAGEEAAPEVIRGYNDILRAVAERFLLAHEAAAKAELTFEAEHKALAEAMTALEPGYKQAIAAVKKHVPEAALPESFAGIASLFDRSLAVEALLNILDDSIMENAWAVEAMRGSFGHDAPGVLRELGEAALSSPSLGRLNDSRAAAYAPALERHRVFKRVVRKALGPQSGQYQSIHWRAAWDQEGAGPVSWGPFSFRAPFRTW